jgi:tripartite-type tricarboxylate transporter receptor subunit TctC
VVERINSEVNKIVRSKEMEERLRADGVSPSGGTAEALQEQIRREIVMWRDAVKAADIKIQ